MITVVAIFGITNFLANSLLSQSPIAAIASTETANWLVTGSLLLLLTAIGLGFGYVAKRLVRVLCDHWNIDEAAKKGDLIRLLQQVGIQQNPSWITGVIIMVLVTYAFLVAGANILGLDTTSTVAEQIIGFTPRIILAAIILIVGLLAATLLHSAMVATCDRANISGGRHLATTCFYITTFAVILVTFEQLQMRSQLLTYVFLIAFSALAIAAALAAGLGSRDVVAGMAAGYYIRRRFQIGDQVNIAGLHGTVREVGMVTTIVETDDSGLLKRHNVPNVKMLNEAVS